MPPTPNTPQVPTAAVESAIACIARDRATPESGLACLEANGDERRRSSPPSSPHSAGVTRITPCPELLRDGR